MNLGDRVPLELALVRVWRGDVPVGAGFLAGPEHILTAAHVVTDAVGDPNARDLPSGAEVTVDFPLLAPDQRLRTRVVAWRPPVPGRGNDIAGLRLLDPAPVGARPLVLSRRRGDLAGPLVMVGFPRGLELGCWAYGRLGGAVATGWIEIESDPQRQSAIRSGFSGTPVWSPDADAVIGMVGYKVTGADAKIGYMVPVDALLTAWPDLVEVIEHRAPFRALRAFGEQDADLYYGREDLVEHIVDRIHGAASAICVIGGSGSGKSSLWQAGVVPRLRADEGLLIATLRPSDAGTPLNALAFALDSLLEPDRDILARLDAVAGLSSRLAQGMLPDTVAVLLERRRANRLLLCVDQFEEVFGLPADQRASFIGALHACLAKGSRFSVLLNLRDTFLGAALRERSAAEMARRWLPITLGEMNDADLRRVMTMPLRRVGTVDFADGLVERILQDLRRTPNPLPLLEFTLAELWDRRSGGWLTHEAYERLGGVSEALAGYAERVWAGIDPATRSTADRLLVQLVRPLPGDELTVRRTALRAECDDAQWAVAQRLATTRLLVLHEIDSGREAGASPGVELAHDSLLTHWEHLRVLTDQLRDFRIWQEALRQRVGAWSSGSSPNSRLLSGADLRDAKRWSAKHGEHLSERDRSYIAASVRRRRRLASGIGITLAVALITAIAVYQHRSGQVAQAVAADLAAKARQLQVGDSYGAMQLAMRAYRTNSSVGLDAVTATGGGVADKLVPDDDFVTSGTDIGTAPTNGASASAATGPQSRPVDGQVDTQLEIGALAQTASADGRSLVTVDPAGHVVLWHLSGQGVQVEPLSALFGPNDLASTPVISRSGRYIAFHQLVLPNLDTQNVNGPFDQNGLIDPSRYHTCVPQSLVAMTPCLVVYDTLQHQVVFAKEFPQMPIAGDAGILSIDPTDQILGMVISGNLVPTVHDQPANTLYLINLHTGQLLRQVILPWSSEILNLWLNPGGQTAIVADDLINDITARADLSLSFVDLRHGAPARRPMVDDPSTLTAVALSLDGRTIAALARDPGDGTMSLVAWDSGTGTVITRIPHVAPPGLIVELSLDATGATAWISTIPQNFGVLQATSVQQFAQATEQLMPQVSVWSLANGSSSGPFTYPDATVWPIGTGASAPLVLVNDSTLALVLPHPGLKTPLQRLIEAAADPVSASRTPSFATLCALLGEPNQDKATRKLVPAGAYQGRLCP